MTTATLPDIDIDQDLEAWLQGEIEKPCEQHPYLVPLAPVPSANWSLFMATGCKSTCATRRQEFACTRCKEELASDPLGVRCALCHASAKITWIERIR